MRPRDPGPSAPKRRLKGAGVAPLSRQGAAAPSAAPVPAQSPRESGASAHAASRPPPPRVLPPASARGTEHAGQRREA